MKHFLALLLVILSGNGVWAAPSKHPASKAASFIPKGRIILQKEDSFWALDPKTGRSVAISIPGYLPSSSTHNGRFHSKTVWSSDATQVLFTESYSEPRYATESLWLNDLKTGIRFKIPTKNSVLNFQFTPDGSKVVVMSEDVYTGEYSKRNLAVYDIKTRKFTLKKKNMVDYSMSGDGKSLVFHAPWYAWAVQNGEVDHPPPDLYWMRLDGTGEQKLPASFQGQPFLNFDGTQLFLSSNHALSRLTLPDGKPEIIFGNPTAAVTSVLPLTNTKRFIFGLVFGDYRHSTPPVYFRFAPEHEGVEGTHQMLAANSEIVFSPDAKQYAFFARDGLHVKQLDGNPEQIFRIFPDKTVVQWL